MSTPNRDGDDPAATRAAVADTLSRLSSAWRERRYDELAEVFDEHIIMMLPGFSGRIEGRNALIESYREFMDRTTLTHYEEAPPTIDVWGSTAVTAHRWTMRWLDAGVASEAAGAEVFIFSRQYAGAGQWRAVWRTIALDPAGE